MLELFKTNRKNTLMIKAPMEGRLIAIEDVPDPVFSQKILGDGLAIDPVEGKVVSPVEGEVLHITPTKHSVGIRSNCGVEILVHVGIDTVKMKGKDFENHVSMGDKIKTGQLLITFDLETVKKEAKSTITPIIITNMEEIRSLEKSDGSQYEWIIKVLK